MKVVVAPDKFKDSLSAAAAAHAIARGIRRVVPDVDVDLCPMADGGEGTVAALVEATGGRFEHRRVTGPLSEMKVDAVFGILGNGKTAVIEMAAASGLALLQPADRNPLLTTTFGTGELLVAAAKLGVEEILLGIGGSATTDAGIGCAQAAGLPVLLDGGEPTSDTEPITGGDLDRVVLVKHGRGSVVERVRLTVACDVSNPLFGPTGAAVVYGPQKGATGEQVVQLDRMLREFATRTGKLAEAAVPGAGAAGGLGFAMLAFFHATLRPGIDIVIDATRLRDRLAGADLCITGEGRFDASSLHGKAPIGVAQLCRTRGVPCCLIAGAVAEEAATQAAALGVTSFYPLHDGSLPLERSLREADGLLASAAERAVRALQQQ